VFIVPEYRDHRCLSVFIGVKILIYRDEIGRIPGMKLAFIGAYPANLPQGRPFNPSRRQDKLKFKFSVHRGTYCFTTEYRHRLTPTIGVCGTATAGLSAAAGDFQRRATVPHRRGVLCSLQNRLCEAVSITQRTTPLSTPPTPSVSESALSVSAIIAHCTNKYL